MLGGVPEAVALAAWDPEPEVGWLALVLLTSGASGVLAWLHRLGAMAGRGAFTGREQR
jgi:hypothetical protein